jgi:hypothetical protein
MQRLITNSLMAILLAGSALLITGAPALAAESSPAAVSAETAGGHNYRPHYGDWHCHGEWNHRRHEWQGYCHHHGGHGHR